MQRINASLPARIVAIALLALGATTVQAQGPGQGQARADEQEPRFKIELIVFRYEAGNPAEEDLAHGAPPAGAAHRLQVPGIDLETVFGDPDEPLAIDTRVPGEQAGVQPRDALEPIELGGDDDFGAAAANDLPPDFRRLGQDELELGNVSARLQRAPYSLIAHTGWIQSGVDEQPARSVDLRYLGLTNPTGSVRVRRGRFFFVALNIDVRDGPDVYFDPGANTGLTPLMRGNSYHFELERSAIREGQPHFFDHPLFGVIVRVTPVADELAGERPAA
jgi:hypothetical protein